MKVSVWVETQCDADVSVTDFIAAMHELPEEESVQAAISAISTCHSVLKRIPDANIAQMNDKQRKLIGDALLVESQRYQQFAAQHEEGK